MPTLAVWVPTSVKGYTAAEMRSFGSDDVMELDVSKWELDTPALCVDLDGLEANLAKMQQTVSRNGIASRPHAKTHKCPAIARMQLESGSVGICTAKVSEAVAMYEHGIDRIVMTTINATPFKIQRAMNLRRQCSGFVQATVGSHRMLEIHVVIVAVLGFAMSSSRAELPGPNVAAFDVDGLTLSMPIDVFRHSRNFMPTV